MKRENSTAIVKHNRKSVLTLMILIISVLLLTSACNTEKADTLPTTKPNILVMVADDAGWKDVGYHGSEINTPAIDRLAQEGVALNRFYVAPTCSPTRASLLTGKYPSRFGILGPIGGKSTQVLAGDAVNLPRLLKENGYQTALMGKWHLGLSLEAGPNKYGFDETYGYLHGQIDQYKHVYKYGDTTWHRNGTFVDEEGHATDLITAETVKYLKEKRDTSKPFFLEVAFSVPHFPLQEEEKWVEPYENVIDNESRRMFAASMTHMDYAIQKIMDALKEENLEENTLVIFLSDNGGQEDWYPGDLQYNGEHGPNDVLGNNRPLRDWKKSLYEGGIRVPAIFYWNGVLKSKTTDEMISVADLLPTIASVTGSEISQDTKLDGKDVWKVIADDASLDKREIYGRTKKQISLIYGDWKLIHNGDTPAEGENKLYNIQTDPYEQNNVASEHPEIVEELQKRMNQIAASDMIVNTPEVKD